MTDAVYDDDRQRSTVTTDAGETIDTQYLIAATGCLSVSKAPEIPGADRFQSPIYHTSHWPHEGVELTGLKVGVIGTGSSGIQSIPIFAEDEVAAMKGRYPAFREAQRTSGFRVPIEAATLSALEVDDNVGTATYQGGWEVGNLVAILASYTDTLTSKESPRRATRASPSRPRGRPSEPRVGSRRGGGQHPPPRTPASPRRPAVGLA